MPIWFWFEVRFRGVLDSLKRSDNILSKLDVVLAHSIRMRNIGYARLSTSHPFFQVFWRADCNANKLWMKRVSCKGPNRARCEQVAKLLNSCKVLAETRDMEDFLRHFDAVVMKQQQDILQGKVLVFV